MPHVSYPRASVQLMEVGRANKHHVGLVISVVISEKPMTQMMSSKVNEWII